MGSDRAGVQVRDGDDDRATRKYTGIAREVEKETQGSRERPRRTVSAIDTAIEITARNAVGSNVYA